MSTLDREGVGGVSYLHHLFPGHNLVETQSRGVDSGSHPPMWYHRLSQ